MKNLSIHVTGKVQGVFFRASTKAKADELGIKGTVRNNEDGSVAVEAEGEDEQLDQFISWCRIGPTSARVDRLDVKEGAIKGYRDFSISR